jgi:hypothetical protein
MGLTKWGRISRGQDGRLPLGEKFSQRVSRSDPVRRPEGRPPPSPTGGNGKAQVAEPAPTHREDPVERQKEKKKGGAIRPDSLPSHSTKRRITPADAHHYWLRRPH